MKATHSAAVFQVTDVRKAIAYYCKVLGYSQEFIFGDPPFYGSVKMGESSIHLCSSPASAHRCGLGSAYVFCEGIDAYYKKIRSKRAKITSKLSDQPYGMRDFQAKDPDGNLIGFGMPVRGGAEK